jgi:hypothetical protein
MHMNTGNLTVTINDIEVTRDAKAALYSVDEIRQAYVSRQKAISTTKRQSVGVVFMEYKPR